MFKEIYLEIRNFFKGPIINHHNMPVSTTLIEFIEKAYNVEIDDTCYCVKNDDESRFYLNYISDDYEVISFSTLMNGKDIFVFLKPNPKDNEELRITMGAILVSTIETITDCIRRDYIVASRSSKLCRYLISIPFIYFSIVKSFARDEISISELYDCYMSYIDYTDEDGNRLVPICSKRFFEILNSIYKKFEETRTESNIQFGIVNDLSYNDQESFEKFIFRYLDCSFIGFEKELIKEIKIDD